MSYNNLYIKSTAKEIYSESNLKSSKKEKKKRTALFRQRRYTGYRQQSEILEFKSLCAAVSLSMLTLTSEQPSVPVHIFLIGTRRSFIG